MRWAALAIALLGCAEGVDMPPCQSPVDPSLDVSPGDVPFGEFTDGEALFYGNPPQGGAPYSPFRIRVGGLAALDEGATVLMSGTDVDDGADLGSIEYPTNFVCANVGDSAGLWVSADLHFRFFGWELDDLEGREAEVTIEVVDVSGESLVESLEGELVRY